MLLVPFRITSEKEAHLSVGDAENERQIIRIIAEPDWPKYLHGRPAQIELVPGHGDNDRHTLCLRISQGIIPCFRIVGNLGSIDYTDSACVQRSG